MKHISYTKSMMQKFGKEIHQAKLETGYIKKFLMWCINSKYRKSVRLHTWLKEQTSNPSKELKELALSLKGSTRDITVINILKWVHKYTKYVTDEAQWDMKEYWQTAEETLEPHTGDCEDFSVMVYVLCILAEVPVYQLCVTCGTVVGGGHCYVIYSADYDGVDRILDGTYWYDSTGIVKRKYAYSDKRYLKEWFRFNSEGTYIIK